VTKSAGGYLCINQAGKCDSEAFWRFDVMDPFMCDMAQEQKENRT